MNIAILICLACLLVIGIIVFASNYFNKKAIVRRKLKKAPARKISNFADGEIAKIVGKVELISKPLIAPLSGRQCAYYYVLIEQYESTGKSSHWKTIIEEEVAGTFGMRDGNYCAQIESKDVKTYIIQDRKYSSGFMNDASEVLVRYLKKYGKESENILGFNKTLRYKEGILEEGELITVLGKGTWKTANQDQFADTYGKVLVISSSKETNVYMSDDPKTVNSSTNKNQIHE